MKKNNHSNSEYVTLSKARKFLCVFMVSIGATLFTVISHPTYNGASNSQTVQHYPPPPLDRLGCHHSSAEGYHCHE
jgi:hypothetical protein